MTPTTSPSITTHRVARHGKVIELVWQFCGLTSGRLVHECIQEPKELAYPVNTRSKRLMHGAQVSLW